MAIRRNRLKVGIGFAVAIVAAAATWLWLSNSSDHAASFVLRTPSTTHVVGKFQKKPSVDASSEVVRSSKGESALVTYKKVFAESHDYWIFAQHVLPAAQAGDADAQFFLSKALQFCTQVNDNYFQLNGKPLTLDEGLQYAASLKLSMELVQSMYDRCKAFREHDATALGTASDWLEKATEAGQPAAQATTAAEMLQQQLMRNFSRAGAAPTADSTAPLIGNGADPTELIRAAVQSRDPEALLNIGWAQALLNPGKEANTEYLAWTLVACERGLDCSANSDWVRTHCSYCDASSPVNLVRSKAGNAWPSVQQRAQELGAKLDAGQWNELGLGS
jgi:hypothetical protein